MSDLLKTKSRNAWTQHCRKNRIKYPKTCSRCGMTKQVEAHHDDYTKPLDVLFVCRGCHRQLHAESGIGVGGRPKFFNFGALDPMEFVIIDLPLKRVSPLVHNFSVATDMLFKCFTVSGGRTVVFRTL